MKYYSLIMSALLAGLVVACGGSGGGTTTPAAVSVTLSAQVYDQAVANAEVSVYVGSNTTPVATTTTDSDGNFSVNLSVTEAIRANNCVVVARRDNISLRSLLGNVGAIADTATANSGTVTATELPSANVTNVSTAVAAIIKQSGGALPSSQADIDTALAAIANDPAVQQTVLQIAAAIKAVVDYGGTNLLGGADTDALADLLAASSTLAADLVTVLTDSDAGAGGLDQLVLEVAGDPLLATQLPSDDATLVAGLAGNTYVTNASNGEETLVQFVDATNLKIAEYSDIEGGGIAGTYTDNQDGTLTVNYTDSVDGPQVVVVTVTGGSTNAINTNVVSNGVDEGPHTFRRMIPVGASATANQIGVANIANSMLVDIDTSTAVQIGASCDGTANAILRSSVGELTGATCNVAMGMLVINHANYSKTMHGLMADSWNGTTASQQMSVANWKADATLGSVASYSRYYTPIDTGIPTVNRKLLRILPSNSAGGVSASLQFVTALDSVPGNNAANGGNIDVYSNSSGGIAKSKDHLLQTTTVLTGALKVNGSVNTGENFASHVSTTIGINLGNNANSKLGAVINPNNATYPNRMMTRYVYNLRDVTAGDVSGKTFSFTDLVFDSTATIVFNADNTGVFTETGASPDPFTWSIEAAVPPANEAGITSGVSSYGTTLKLTNADGTVDYMFVKELGTSFIVAGYYILADGTFDETWAGLITPQ